MTEDQAKTKWCPFYRVAITGESADFSDNRPAHYDKRPGDIGEPNTVYTPNGLQASCCCIGSACMAWRETKLPTPAREVEYREKTPDDPLGQDESKPLLKRIEPARSSEGFCAALHFMDRPFR